MKKILLLLSTTLLFSCSAEKRLARLVLRHPELIKTDTVFIQDTTIIPETKADTVLQAGPTVDTIYIEKEKLKIKYYATLDSVYIEGKCDPDTIIKTIPIKVQTISPVKVVTKTPKWAYIMLGAFLLLLILLVLIALYKRHIEKK